MRLFKLLFLFYFFSVFALSAKIIPVPFPAKVQTGDLIFVNSEGGELGRAIIEVTKAQFVGGPDLNHVGLLEVRSPREIYIYEARPKVGTVRTPYVDFVKRLQSQKSSIEIKDRMIIGRIRSEYRGIFIRAAGYAKGELGLSYNDSFSQENKGHYCSEWIQTLSWRGNGKKFLWKWHKMFFGKPGTQGRKLIQKYYEKIRQPIPDGELGVSPLSLFMEGKGRIFDVAKW
ncbi:MAG: hypothetical protein JWQ35_1840 [Bacteriovoracaceae bacterium]|nr:hypothetical protein [Bacteriovoracaceae bacterium]